MSTLAVSNNIVPGTEITFRLTAEFFGYGNPDGGPDIKFIAPKACPLINKVDGVFYKSSIVNKRVLSPKTYGFTRYARPTDYKIGTGYYKLKFGLSSEKANADLQTGDSVLLVSSNPKLAQLNNKVYEVLGSSGNDSRTLLLLKIKNSDQPTVLPTSSASGVVTEVNKTIKVQEFTVSVPKVIYDNLVTQKDPGLPKIGDVEDIIIYTYKRYTGNNDAGVKKKLMVNDAEIDEKNPPNRGTIVDYREKTSYKRQFDIDDEKNIEFYISIARYIYTKDNWVGQWLQTNTSENAIWKRAKKG